MARCEIMKPDPHVFPETKMGRVDGSKK